MIAARQVTRARDRRRRRRVAGSGRMPRELLLGCRAGDHWASCFLSHSPATREDGRCRRAKHGRFPTGDADADDAGG
jgi:hypothetical protein